MSWLRGSSELAQEISRMNVGKPVKNRMAGFRVGLFLVLLIPANLTMAAEVKFHTPTVRNSGVIA